MGNGTFIFKGSLSAAARSVARAPKPEALVDQFRVPPSSQKSDISIALYLIMYTQHKSRLVYINMYIYTVYHDQAMFKILNAPRANKPGIIIRQGP